MWNNTLQQTMNSVTCPGCGLSCDDLQITVDDGQLKSLNNSCEKARSFYNTAFDNADPTPMIEGSASTMDEALSLGAQLLRDSVSPLFAGLVTDVNGMRSILNVADHCGATLDHLNGDAMFRNLRVVQDNGWFTTTFSEVRNRADLVLLVGKQATDRFPRLVERVFHPQESLFTKQGQRKIVLLGPWQDEDLPGELAALNPTVIATEIDSISDTVSLLRGLVAGKPVNPGHLGDSLTGLAEQLLQAKYSVICWSAAELDMPHAELIVQGLAELAKALNEKNRSAALPLAGSQGDITSNQVCTWQLGYPLRTRLNRGYPEHDPRLNRWQDLLSRGESDLLIWTSSLSPQALPPVSESPTIVLGHAGMKFEKQPTLFIPVGVPGIDHHGHWYRSDSVCPLPLGKLRDSDLPSVARVMQQLLERVQSNKTASERTSAC
ncbi:MAG: formylmethanofuran dehydrogenase subunit B [Candidatus Thiodiazotropha sp. 6PLUC2]